MILLVIGGFNVFTSVLLMIGNDPLQQKQVPLTYMYDQAFSFLDFGYGSAISFLLTTVVLALAGLQYVVDPAARAGDVQVIVGDRRQRIAGMGTRYAMLIIAAVVLVLPFVVHGVDLAQVAVVGARVPTEAHPGPPHHRQLRRRLGLAELRSVLPELARSSAIATTALTVLLAAMMAYGFARFDFPGRRALFAAVVVGLMVPTMAADHPAVPARTRPADARQALRPGAVLRRHAAGVQHVPAARLLRTTSRASSTRR